MGAAPIPLLCCMPKAPLCSSFLGFIPFFFTFYYLAVSNFLVVETIARPPTTSLSQYGGGGFEVQHRDFPTEFAPHLSPAERVELAVRRSKARKERIEGMLSSKVKEYNLYRQGYNSKRKEVTSASKARMKERKSSNKIGLERASSAIHRKGASNYGKKARQEGVISRASIISGDYAIEMEKGDGAFLTSVYIGTPPRKTKLILDTGSDLVWQQCQPCESCYKQPDEPIFDPSLSSSFRTSHCSDALCQALLPTACFNENASCPYTYMYGDTSFTSGELAYDTLILSEALGQDHLKIDEFAFGCGYASRGASFEGSDGILGMGQGPLSLASQLSSPSFSYCFSSFDKNQSTPLFLGEHAKTVLHTDNSSQVKVTPILQNRFMPSFYYLNLLGISMDEMRLNFSSKSFLLKSNGTGGIIVDSGTTITYLEEHGYRIVHDAIQSRIKDPPQKPQPMFGLDLCYSTLNESTLPTLTFHFDNADMYLSPSNLFFQIGGVHCFALSGSHGISILGNMQQRNYQMVYDLEKQNLYFMHTTCD